jgi:hypothetical protein
LLTVLVWLYPLVALGLAPALAAQAPATISGVVEDAQSGAPVADVLVTIENTNLRAVTDPQGRFRLQGLPVGNVRVVLRHVAYGEHGRPLVIGATGPLDFRIRISTQAIELSPLVVEVLSDDELARRASGNSIDLIDRQTIDAFAVTGQSLVNVLGREVPGIRISSGCIEYRLQTRSRAIGFVDPDDARRDPVRGTVNDSCRELAVYLDGVRMREGTALLETLSLHDLERIEVLSPGEAGVRYPGADRGVIVLETRRGVIPETTTPRVTVTGFGWDEPRPYRWGRVLGTSVVANALVVRASYSTFVDCNSDIAGKCGGMVAAVAGMVSGTISALITRWAGGSSRSQGRTLPALLAGTATATLGYVLLLDSENTGSDVSRTAGHAVLAIGVPVTLTLSDRVFRVLK